MNDNELESLKNYLGLESIEDTKKYLQIMKELESYGHWGNKISSYLTSILSNNEGYKSFIPPKQVELYKTLFNDLTEYYGGE